MKKKCVSCDQTKRILPGRPATDIQAYAVEQKLLEFIAAIEMRGDVFVADVKAWISVSGMEPENIVRCHNFIDGIIEQLGK